MDMSAPIAINLPPEAMAVLRRKAQARVMSPATLAHLMLVEMLAPGDPLPSTVAVGPHPSLFPEDWDEGDDIVLIEDD